MPWKKDDKGFLVVDETGNPVWMNEAGEDKPVDYAALGKRLSEVNAESKSRKEELRKANEKLRLFENIEDLPAWKAEADKAIETAKSFTDKEKDAAAQFQARLEAALAPKDKAIAELDRTIAEQKAVISGMRIQADVMDSKILGRIKPETRLLLQRELMRAGALDDEGKIYYRNAKGDPLYGETGSYASKEEAPLMLLKELGIDSSTVLLSQEGDTTGSGGKPKGAGHVNIEGKKYSDCKTLDEKMAWLRDERNLKQQRST